MAVKLLFCGFENCGKSTVTSKLADAMVVNFDKKEYSFDVPHVNVPTWTLENAPYGPTAATIDLINTKLGVYQEVYKKLPSTIILDTVTQFYTGMASYNATRYTGFEEHAANNTDTMALNNYIEDVLIANGLNVIIVAHTIYDSETSRHLIPATGKFKDAGSWLSVVNDSVFIEKKTNKLVAHLHSLKYPCRTTLKDFPASEPIPNVGAEPGKGEYDINAHMALLTASKVEATKFVL